MLHFILEGEPSRRRYWWLVVDRDAQPDVDVCRSDPGHRVSLTITATVRAMVDVVTPNAELGEALKRGILTVEGRIGRGWDLRWMLGGSAGGNVTRSRPPYVTQVESASRRPGPANPSS